MCRHLRFSQGAAHFPSCRDLRRAPSTPMTLQASLPPIIHTPASSFSRSFHTQPLTLSSFSVTRQPKAPLKFPFLHTSALSPHLRVSRFCRPCVPYLLLPSVQVGSESSYCSAKSIAPHDGGVVQRGDAGSSGWTCGASMALTAQSPCVVQHGSLTQQGEAVWIFVLLVAVMILGACTSMTDAAVSPVMLSMVPMVGRTPLSWRHAALNFLHSV